MSSKKRSKAGQRRPTATTAISQPIVEDSSILTSLSSFSSDAEQFALLSLAIDKHRLRVYNTVTCQSVAELIVDSGRVSALTWGTFDPTESMVNSSSESSSRKKKRKRDTLVPDQTPPGSLFRVVILGLSDGTILFFSTTHGRVIRTLSHPTSNFEITSISFLQNEDHNLNVWTSGADGTIRLWDARKNQLLGSWKTDDRTPHTSLALRSFPKDDRVKVLAAYNSIHMLSLLEIEPNFKAGKSLQLASFTGHTSPVRQLQWDVSKSPPTHFVSRADTDRFLYFWEFSEGLLSECKPTASISLDSDVRTFSLAISQQSSTMADQQTLFALSASGKLSIFPLPSDFSSAANSKRVPRPFGTLVPRSTIITPNNQMGSSRIIDAKFLKEGTIRIARIVGIRPVFDEVCYLDASGDYVEEVVVGEIREPPADLTLPVSTQRYLETPSLAVSSGLDLAHDLSMGEIAESGTEGDLDVDLAELSLGQRLTVNDVHVSSSESDHAGDATKENAIKKKDVAIIPTESLARTLIQALHSSDSRLLETCLAHSDTTLIRNTVKRLPPQLSVPLIDACVERLGRGARGSNMKGRGGGTSSQRGTGLISWVRSTLTIHSGHLMTVPDLVARLSGLHAMLTSRLSLQESLLNISGRLDMALSQIESRFLVASEPAVPLGNKRSGKYQSSEFLRYSEGESDEEGESGNQRNFSVKISDEEGSVEDVELGRKSDVDIGSEDENEDDEDEDEDHDEGPTLNGFIDDEAEEDYSEEEEDDSE